MKKACPMRFPINLFRRLLVKQWLGIVTLLAMLPHMPALHAQQQLPLKFERFTLEDGLPTSPIAGPLIKDEQGIIWFGTWTGFYRYDGYTFNGYWHDPEDSLSISDDWAQPFIDRAGVFWVGTGAGLDRFDSDRGAFSHYRHDPDDPTTISNGAVVCIYEDRQGRLWIGTNDGLNIFDRRSERFTRYQYDPEDSTSLFGNQVRTIYEDDRGTIWIGTGNPFSRNAAGCLNRFDNETRTFQRYFVEPANKFSQWNYVQAIYQELGGDLWIAAWERGLFQFNRQTGRFTRLPYLDYPTDKIRLEERGITCIAEQPGTDFLWMATFGGGLHRYNRKTKQSSSYLFDPGNPFSLRDNRVWSVNVDPAGILWVGTHGGLNKADLAGKFPRYRLDLQPEEWVTDIYEDDQGIAWLATTAMRLVRWDRQMDKVTSYKPPLAHCKSWNIPGAAVTGSRKGGLWFANDCGLFAFNPESGTFTRSPNKANDLADVTSNQRLRMIEDSHGMLWLVAQPLIQANLASGEVIRYVHDPRDSTSINSNDVEAIFEDREGVIWVGTADGIGRFERSAGKFSRMLVLRSGRGQNAAIGEINQDDEGWLCLATDTYGLIRLNPATGDYKKYTIKEGLHSNTIYNIVRDHAGAFWLFARAGATRYDPRSGATKFFDESAGLADMQFPRRSVYPLRNGEIILGGRGAVNVFNPENHRGNVSPPPVVLTGLRISGALMTPGAQFPLKKSLAKTGDIFLAHNQNDLTFEYVALDYKNAALNRYQYRLENYDRDWIAAGTQRSVRYTNLNPGRYRFRVKAANSDGVWNEEGVSLNLTIAKPWWGTWWAYTLYGVIFFGLLYSLRRYEMNRILWKNRVKLENIEKDKLRELDQLKSRFFANISHEFRTPLALILAPIEKALMRAGERLSVKDLQLVRYNANFLLRLINQLLDLARLESGKLQLQAQQGDVVRFLKAVTMVFESQAARKQINLRFASKPEQITAWFDRRKLEDIFYNLLSNAIKFTPQGGSVIVDCGLRIADSAISDLGFQVTDLKDQSQIRNPQSEMSDFVKITVKDTGIGIPAEHLSRIFDRYYQVGSSDKHENEGVGIGLMLVKELVELHHGAISIASAEPTGTTVTVRLPLGKTHLKPEEMVESTFPQALDTPQSLEEISDFDFRKTTPAKQHTRKDSDDDTIVLIIEDNADLRDYMREYLQSEYRVLEAKDGEEGIDKALETIPDLVISDVMMPGKDGYQVCATLKADVKTSHIPIILLTAKAEAAEKIQGLETGADAYMTKPFSFEELVVRARNLIDLRRQLRQRFSGTVTLKPSEIAVSSMDAAFLERLLAIVEKHLAEEKFNVETLAREAAMSRSQIHRKLRALTNQSCEQFILSVRLQRAAELLRQKAATVSEIAYQTGFGSPSYFAACFKKQFGCSPSKWLNG
ncbi:MAG: hypothetical protein CV087_16680 [Candidatus Brocadia sp. WS118]|nr:MAG: hypothetical protein CV087_16680 [Candidatus Brocadia sp. WS118]